ncbi:uncharacterized protein LOC143214771 isoform X2 [Lasioglossum baleicum]
MSAPRTDPGRKTGHTNAADTRRNRQRCDSSDDVEVASAIPSLLDLRLEVPPSLRRFRMSSTRSPGPSPVNTSPAETATNVPPVLDGAENEPRTPYSGDPREDLKQKAVGLHLPEPTYQLCRTTITRTREEGMFARVKV